MASAKVLEAKKAVINEIEELVKNSESVVVFSYQGLTVSALNKLRRELKDVDGEIKS
jgi:ribosomal protein L10